MMSEWAKSFCHTETVDYALKFRETVKYLRETASMKIIHKVPKKYVCVCVCMYVFIYF